MTETRWAIEGVEKNSGREVREVVHSPSRAEAVARTVSRGITITSIEEAATPPPPPAADGPRGEREALERIARSPLITEPIWTIAQGVVVGSILLAVVIVVAAIALAVIIGGIGAAAGR